MQYKIRVYLLLALIIALAFSYYQGQKYESLSNLLFDENTQLKQKLETLKANDLNKKIKTLEEENKALKEQIFQLERQEFLFKSNEQPKYNLEESLKFQDDTKGKDIKPLKEDKKEEEYIITPSVDIDTEKKEIDGLKLKIETKF